MYWKEKVRDILVKFSPQNTFVEKLLMIARWNNIQLYKKMSDVDYARYLWKRKGKTLNLVDPKTFDEKIWYLKLSNRDPQLTLCSDKHGVREYVTRCGLSDILKHEYTTFANATEIDFSKLPSPCYLKCNHASGMNWVFRREKEFHKKHIIWKFNYYLKQNTYLYSREWNYKNIEPKIVCEELLSMPDGSSIPELQFFCFNGVPKLVMYNLGLADSDGYHKKALRWVFDSDYQLIHMKTSMETTDIPPVKPKNYDRMIEIAKVLSKPFPHVRVDLFNIDGQIFFNEMTFYSGGGFVKMEPQVWQDRLGDWLDISGFSIAEDAYKKNKD